MAISTQTALVPSVNTSAAPMMGAPGVGTGVTAPTSTPTATNPSISAPVSNASVGAAAGAGLAGIGSSLAGAAGNTGLASILNSIGGLGQTAVGVTGGQASAAAFDTQANNAIGAQQQYLGNAVGAANTGIGNTQGQLGNSQNYTGAGVSNQNNLLNQALGYNTNSAIGAQQGLYSVAQGNASGGITNQANLLNQAVGYNQAGLNEANTAGSALTNILGGGANGASQTAQFDNTPGYQFAVGQGQNAINRQAAASGGLYSTSTLAGLSQYNTGMASQNYNNYVNQLMSMAGLGNQAAGVASNAAVNTGANQGALYNASMSNALATGQGEATSFNDAATNAIQSGSIDAGLYNQASINPLTAAGLQQQGYSNQGTYNQQTGQQISDIYQNAGQYNSAGIDQQVGALNQGLSPTGGISNLLGGTSGNGIAGLNSLSNSNNSAVSGLNTNDGYINAGTTDNLNGNFSDLDSNMNANTGLNSSMLGGGDPTSSIFGNADTSGLDSLLGNDDLQNLNLGSGGNLLSNFSSAGGQAANGALGSLSDSDVANSLGLSSSAAQDGINSAVGSTSANFGGSLGGLLGAASGVNKIVSDPSNPQADIAGLQGINSAVNTLTGGQGALGSIASSAAPYLGIAGAAASIGMMDYAAIDPKNVPDVIEKIPQGGSVGKLPSGNSILLYNGMGVGAGSEETKGSGEIYQIGANGKQNWIGQANSSQLERDYDTLRQAQLGYTVGQSQQYGSSGTTSGTGIASGVQVAKGASGSGTGLGAQASNATTQVKLTPAQQQTLETSATQNMSSIYNSTGGAAYWGQSVNEWLENMNTLLGSMSQTGTYWGGDY